MQNYKQLILVTVSFAILSACNGGGSGGSNQQPSSPVSESNVTYFQNICNSSGGYFQYGVVNSPPNSDYSSASQTISGVPLSHTHIEITSALDNKIYDIAINNVYASNYNVNSGVVPPSFSQNLTAGSYVFLCSGNKAGVPYPMTLQYAKYGIDWVHTNCGNNSKYTNGWLYDSNNLNQNLTGSQTYCYLFNS